MTSSASALPYRPEIDGLRSIAVLSVVLFHFAVPGFSGGFVGVDVFFVISGFLIGSLLWREYAAEGTIALGRFYVRRFRRLAPAYFVMAAVSAGVGYLVLLPFELREFGKTLITSTVSLSNVYFYMRSGYFDAGADEKVLLHTWSLSVEEQFYILFPVSLLLLGRLRAPVGAVLAAAALVSLVACVYATRVSHTAAFYLFPFRAWELLAGVLLAVHGARTGARWRHGPALSWAGLALLAGAVALVEPGAAFPGYQAAVPVLGTLMLLANGADANPVNRALSAPVPVLIGLMSYSLYLWHWPVLTLSRYWRDGYQGGLEAGFWLAVAFALAWLSWRFVELPVRRARALPAPMLLGGVAAASAGLLLVGGLVYRGDGLPGRFAPHVLVHVDASQDFLQDWRRCAVPADGPLAGIEVCRLGPADREPTFLAWGTRTCGRSRRGSSSRRRRPTGRGCMIWRAGCPPLFGLDKRESAATRQQDRDCRRANARIRAALPELAGIDKLLLVGRWTYYAEGAGTGGDAHNTIALAPAPGSELAPGPQAELFGRAVAASVGALRAAGKEILVLRQVPEIPAYHSGRVARRLAHGRLAPGPEVERLARVPRAELLRRSAAAEAPFAALAARGEVVLLDSWEDLCGPLACSALQAGRSLYFDNNHVTNTGARALRGLFAPLLGQPFVHPAAMPLAAAGAP